jgi:AcrR family transcriptional regulator/DNA-binding MarR family transcriptional regulator
MPRAGQGCGRGGDGGSVAVAVVSRAGPSPIARARDAEGGVGVREGVTDLQRARMIAALVDVVRERGVGEATVAHIVTRSGVSRRTFYELFASREDCFLAALEEAGRRASLRVLPAFEGAGRWRERTRAGLTELLAFLEDEPGLGALCLVDALGAGPHALERRTRMVGALVDAVDEGRVEARPGASPTRLTAEGVVGAVLGVLHARLAGPDPGDPISRGRGGGAVSLMSLLGPLMGIVVLPYLGQAAARRETSRPAPKRTRAARLHGDPLRELDMRLTYRTVRVLLAIAAQSGASNRRVADVAGVADQGQISKLLARLEHLGLIDNQSLGHARGEPNSWALTPRGREIAIAVREQGAAADIRETDC